MKISAANLRKLIREELFYREFHKDATTLVEQTGEQFMIAGRKISSATKEEIQSVVSAARRRDNSRPYSNTHELWTSKPGESAEQTVERFIKYSSGGFPGGVTIYQDPSTGEVFGYAKYNTF
jgi:hypothetical protein